MQNKGTEKTRHHSITLNDKSETGNLLVIPNNQNKLNKSKDSGDSQTKTDRKHPSEDNDKQSQKDNSGGNGTSKSIPVKVKTSTDPITEVDVESDDNSDYKNSKFEPKEEVKKMKGENKSDSIDIPLNDSNVLKINKPNLESKKDDLGTIQEEHSSYSTIIPNNQPKSNKMVIS
jgi:hypothetical protein